MPHIKDYTGKRAHMIGIGGSSMSGLAGMLVKLGVRVTGSDSARSYMTDALEKAGIHVFIGQRISSSTLPPSRRITPNAPALPSWAFPRWSAQRCWVS